MRLRIAPHCRMRRRKRSPGVTGGIVISYFATGAGAAAPVVAFGTFGGSGYCAEI